MERPCFEKPKAAEETGRTGETWVLGRSLYAAPEKQRSKFAFLSAASALSPEVNGEEVHRNDEPLRQRRELDKPAGQAGFRQPGRGSWLRRSPKTAATTYEAVAVATGEAWLHE